MIPRTRHNRSRKVAVLLTTSMLAAAMTILPGTALAATIVPVSNDGTGATALATASLAAPATLSAASFDAVPAAGTPNGTSDTLSSFPTDGTTFAILTSGDVNLADDANSSASSGASLGGATPAGRGDSAFDVSILRLDLTTPTGANCLVVDFQFYSEEFPEFVNSSFNDAFIAEYGASTWTTSGSTITAANNFAFDPANEVISINAAGNTSMTAANAAGTTYDGATPLLQAATPTSAGTNSLYLSIFDQGDSVLDSAVFIDNIRFLTVANVSTDCVKGATPVDPPDGGKKTPSTILTKTPSATSVKSGSTVTYTYTETNDGEVDLSSPSVVDDKCSPVTYVSGDANIDGKLNVGETWTFTCSLQLWNTTTNTAVGHGITPDGLDVTWCDPKDVDPKDPKTFPKDVFCDQDEYAQVTVTVQDGCTPGYWKQDQHFDSWVGYTPGQTFLSVGFDNAFPGKTLLQVLSLEAGGLDALGRHTVAALLNSTNPEVVNYPYTTAQVISMFNAAYPGTKAQYTALKNLFAAANEKGCSLN